LEELARNKDTASRDIILSELHNTNRAIRKAALEATVRMNDSSAIPSLKDLAGQTEDAVEKAEITEAIEYIGLPSYSQRMAARSTNSSLPATKE
jgi:hypothetical protein